MVDSIKSGLDYTQKGVWTEQSNIGIVASDLGYVLNDRFTTAYNEFIVTTLKSAKVTNFLFVLAQGHFSRITPPLEKVNGRPGITP